MSPSSPHLIAAYEPLLSVDCIRQRLVEGSTTVRSTVSAANAFVETLAARKTSTASRYPKKTLGRGNGDLYFMDVCGGRFFLVLLLYGPCFCVTKLTIRDEFL